MVNNTHLLEDGKHYYFHLGKMKIKIANEFYGVELENKHIGLDSDGDTVLCIIMGGIYKIIKYPIINADSMTDIRILERICDESI